MILNIVETSIAFEPCVTYLQFWKWQAKSKNKVEPSLHDSICSGGPDDNKGDSVRAKGSFQAKVPLLVKVINKHMLYF